MSSCFLICFQAWITTTLLCWKLHAAYFLKIIWMWQILEGRIAQTTIQILRCAGPITVISSLRLKLVLFVPQKITAWMMTQQKTQLVKVAAALTNIAHTTVEIMILMSSSLNLHAVSVNKMLFRLRHLHSRLTLLPQIERFITERLRPTYKRYMVY